MRSSWTIARALLWSAILLFTSWQTTVAQEEDAADPSQSMREVLESRQRTELLIKERESSNAQDVAQVSSPMTSMLGLVEAFDNGRFSEAASYLDMRIMPRGRDDFTPEQLVRALAYVFGQQNILDISSLSDSPEGAQQDGLPLYLDEVGSIEINSGSIPILMQRLTDADGSQLWKISNSTVQQIPKMWDALGFSSMAFFLHERLPEFTFLGMQNWQVVGFVALCLLAWPLASLATYLINLLAQRVPNVFPLGIERFIRGPLRIFLFILFARLLTDRLGLSLEAQVLLDSSGLDYIGYTVLILGVITLLMDYQARRMQAAGNQNMVALLRPITTVAKVIAIIIIALTWADSAGYNMSTILAGLGVGSLAVALAAQKTLENLIGAITIYSARPVSIGDLCRFGSITGTVEEIGLRSTSIRTLDRSLLVIPNAIFAATELENFSERDYIRYFRKLHLLTEDSEQLRLVLAGIRRMFHAHPRVKAGTSSARLEAAEDATAQLRLDAGIDTNDFQDFLAIAEDINLRVIDIVFAAGAALANTSQLTILRAEKETDTEQRQQVNDMLQEWRSQDKLPFPEYSDSEISRLRGTLDYPPRGSGRAGPQNHE